MKKLLLVVLMVLFSITLTSCQKSNIEPGIINVVFENPYYEGTSFFVDVFITNGTEEVTHVSTMDLWFKTAEGKENIAGALFTIDADVKPDESYYLQLEFSADYLFMSEAVFQTNEYDLKDIELSFYIYK